MKRLMDWIVPAEALRYRGIDYIRFGRSDFSGNMLVRPFGGSIVYPDGSMRVFK